MMNVDRECRRATPVRLWGREGPTAKHVKSRGGRSGTDGMIEELATRKLWSGKFRS
jgi:hypothetical protein